MHVEKAYDKVPRGELWCCISTSGVSEMYVKLVQVLFGNSRTVVRCAVRVTDNFKVEVGLHQGGGMDPERNESKL